MSDLDVSIEANDDNHDTCDRCGKRVLGSELWLGHAWITALGFDGVCDDCMKVLRAQRSTP